MRSRRLISLATACLGVVALGVILVATSEAQQGGPERSVEGKTAEQAFQNIKVLHIPADQVQPNMRFFNYSLGVECAFCHVGGNFAKDDKPEKTTARMMITMMEDINKNNFNGRTEVTCYTCHKGVAEPVASPPFAESTTIGLDGNMPGAPVEESASSEPRSGAMPSVDDILAKYVQALGGEQALRRFTSVTMTGTRETGQRNLQGNPPVESTFEGYAAAPNLQAMFFKDDRGRTTGQGFDGKGAWTQAANGTVEDLAGTDSTMAIPPSRAKRAADFYEPLDLKQEYTRMNVQGMEKVNGHDAWVVLAAPPGDNPERLYFDAQSGLLLRKSYFTSVLAGDGPGEVDYGNYRDAGGVKYPYMIRISDELAMPTYTVYFMNKVTFGTTVDQSKFVRPESKPQPQRTAQAGPRG